MSESACGVEEGGGDVRGHIDHHDGEVNQGGVVTVVGGADDREAPWLGLKIRS
jgi:hypothetical protein